MFSFVNTTGDQGNDREMQRTIRAHAMRDYRRRQRAEQASGTKDTGDLEPSTPDVTAKDAHAAWREHRQKLASQRRARKGTAAAPAGKSSESARRASPSKSPADSVLDEDTSGECETTMAVLSSSMAKLDLSSHISGQIGMSKLDPSTREDVSPAYAAAMFPSSTRQFAGLWMRVQNWLTPRSPAMQSASDAVGLLQLGATSQNGQVLFQARKAHIQCIEHLRRELPDPTADFLAKHVAAQCLLVCEAYTLVGGGDDVWMRHVPGVVSVAASRSPQIVEQECEKSQLANILFSTLRILGLTTALIGRKAYVFGKRKWRNIGMTHEPSELATIMPIITVLPELLERTDVLRAGPQDDNVSGARALKEQLTNLERELEVWLMTTYRGRAEADQVRSPLSRSCRPVSPDPEAGNAPAMSAVSRELPSYATMSYRQLYWTSMLLIRRAKLSLYRLLPERDEQTERTLYAAVEDSVSLLCQCTPFFMESDAIFAKSCAIAGLLFFARQWFDEIGDTGRLSWCDELQESVQRQATYLVWTNLLPWTFWGLMWFT